MTLLVTGGSGALASSLRAVLGATADVTWAVSPRADRLGERDVRLDVTDRLAVDALLEDVRPTAIIHLAGLVGARCESDYETAVAVNVGGVRNIAGAAEVYGVGRVVLASTAAVYGTSYHAPAAENAPIDAVSAYAKTKYAAELELQSSAVQSVALRIFNVFGSTVPNSIVSKLLRSSPGRPTVMFGLEGYVRDYVHAHDVARALLLSVDVTIESHHECFNVGSGVPIDNGTLLSVLGDLGTVHARVEPAQSSYSCADTTRAGSALGFSTCLNLADARL